MCFKPLTRPLSPESIFCSTLEVKERNCRVSGLNNRSLGSEVVQKYASPFCPDTTSNVCRAEFSVARNCRSDLMTAPPFLTTISAY
jgi:hypothetical protein